MEEIYGFIESIVFAEEVKGFCVARLKEPKKKDLTCIVGTMPSIQPGETIRCKGIWKRHPEYGTQFEVQSFDLEAPSDLIGIQKYLESGMIKGIGPAYAERIVKKFGLNTLDVIDENPDRLYDVQGLGEKRVEKIKSCWKDQRKIREVMIFLRGHHVSPAFAQRIYKTYGDDSVEKVKANPYRLAQDVHGIGFKTADSIAEKLGISKDNPSRVDAGIVHFLFEMSGEGHVCYPRTDLVSPLQEMLGVPIAHIEGRIDTLISQGDLVLDDGLLFTKSFFLSEKSIARDVLRVCSAECFIRSVKMEQALSWVQNLLKIELAPEQQKAVSMGLSEKFLVITGGPGTGKSTITNAILKVTEKITGKILLAAPTGRAAKRMSEITGKKASTIHSLLEIDFKVGGFKRNRQNPLECDLLIVDEASMIDTHLMFHLMKAIPSEARVIFIGDIDQLPSVGPGSVLKSLIDCAQVPVVQLKTIFRQAAGSKIIVNAHKVNQGEFPDITYHPQSDFAFIAAEEQEEILQIITRLVKDELPRQYRFDRFEEIQVLSPMKRGLIGIENLNAVLQQSLNPSTRPLQKMGRSFHIGDKVLQLRNNYDKEVFNGDIGKIVAIDFSEEILQVSFDGRYVEYDFLELDELILGYAVSIHKYQGSECPCIIIPIHMSHFKMLYRNLLYTGITRGKKRVVLVGSKKALSMCVRNFEVQKRYFGLEKMLRTELSAT